jgi:hypothetical protein
MRSGYGGLTVGHNGGRRTCSGGVTCHQSACWAGFYRWPSASVAQPPADTPAKGCAARAELPLYLMAYEKAWLPSSSSSLSARRA